MSWHKFFAFVFCGLFFLKSSLCFAQQNSKEKLEILLKEYEEASDLSHKTRIEGLGHYIIFTRKDLELMQAHTLMDVIKSLPFHTIMKTPCGSLIPVIGGTFPFIRPYYVIYIDDHEVSASDTPFLCHIYTEYPLDNIDHIEFYVSYGSGMLGNEPGFIVIKMYNKEPKRENASYIRQTISSTKGYEISLVEPKYFNDFEILFSADYGYINNKNLKVNFKAVKSDTQKRYLFGHLRYKSNHLDFQLAQVKGYAFMLLSRSGSPDVAQKDIKDFFISYSRRFLKNRSLKLNIDMTYSSYKLDSADYLSGLKLPPVNGTYPVSYNRRYNFWKFSLYISKSFQLSKKSHLTSTLTSKITDIQNTRYDIFYPGIGLKENTFPELKWQFYSLLLNYQYNLNPDSLIILTIRDDFFSRNIAKDENNYIIRLGYIKIFKNHWYFKTFLSRFYSPVNFMEVEKAKNPADLRSEVHRGISGELGYRDDNRQFRVIGSYFKSKYVILKTPQGFVNFSGDVSSKVLMVDYRKDLSEHINVELNIWKDFLKDFNYTNKYGGFLKVLGDFGRYNFFGEIIYRAPFSFRWNNLKVSAGDSWDLDLGLSFKLSSKVTLEIKGENLLNDSPKSYNILPNKLITYPSYERKVYLSLEFLF